jgi:hypothetical protein
MDATQQTKLEALSGKSLTQAELAMANDRQDNALAESLSVERTHLVSAMHTELMVLDLLGPVAGGAFLDGLDSFVSAGYGACPAPLQPYFSAIKRSVAALYKEPGLDFGSANTQGVLDLLAQSGIVAAGSSAVLKSIAVHPNPITVDQVSEVLNS